MKKQSESKSSRNQPADLTSTRSVDDTFFGRSSTDTWPEGYRFGQYQVIRPIGAGSSAIVYLVQDLRLERKIAVKVSRSTAAQSDRASKRFLREAKSVAGLQHPNICQVHEFGWHQGHLFIAMSYVHGQAMSDWLESENPSELEIANIIRVLALAMNEAHQNGVIHRDLKPANILMNDQSVPILSDFGLALTDSNLLSARLTQPGLIVGSPAYMSPEQIRNPSNVTFSTDIYSLGVVLYQMLCGTLPHTGEIMTVFRKIALEDPKPPRSIRPDISNAMNAICLKAIEKDPSHRFASMSDFADCLSELIEAGPTSGKFRAQLKSGKHPKSHSFTWPFYLGGIAVVLGLSLAVGLAFWKPDRSKPDLNNAPQVIAKTETPFVQPISESEQLRIELLNRLIQDGLQLEADSRVIDSPVSHFPSTVYAVTTTDYEEFDIDEFAEVLKVVPRFQRLNVRTNDFSRTAWELLVRHCPHELSIEADELTREEMQYIGQLKHLTYLMLTCPTLDDSHLEAISGFTNLRHLSIAKNRVTGSGFRFVAEMNLHELDLTESRVQDKYLSELRLASRIGLLRLAGTPITGKGLAELHQINGLKDLDIGSTNLTNHDISELKNVPLEGFYLAGCDKISDLSTLTDLPIKQLDIRGTSVTNFRPLLKLPLIDIHVDIDSDQDRQLLLSIPTLENLNYIPVENF